MVLLVIRNGLRPYYTHFNLSIGFSQSCNVKYSSCSSHLFGKTNMKLYLSKEDNKDSDIEDKLVYNSVIKTTNLRLDEFKTALKEERMFSKYKKEGAPVIALKYFTEEYINRSLESNQTNEGNTEFKKISQDINFPYKINDHIEIKLNDELTDHPNENELRNNLHSPVYDGIKDRLCKRPKRMWMNDYNKYAEVSVKEEEEDSDEEDNVEEVNYGSADPNIPASNVPCGGCGAHLHCKDPSIPGFLPKELFAGQKSEQLQALVCQRCHFLQQYNTALSVTVDPAFYPRLLSQIKDKYALVILVVDMTDFPCSIWPGILDIIGPKRPLIVVGNKIDLLQDWSKDMLHRAKEALKASLPRKANVLHTALVSAKTGFGIEDLITALYKIWEYRGDVYLVGCTNVGKSMLFNALLQSDYCKTRAVNLIQRATTAPWPGTTLNLLKFPITRPVGWRLAMRALRLKEENIKNLRLAQEGHTQITPQMICQINRTYSHSNVDYLTDAYKDDPFAMPKMESLRKLRAPGSGVDPADPVLAQSKWLYDTPGVITSDQIIDLLTAEELMLTLPQEPLVPRSFCVWAGQSLMVGGLARLDYLSGDGNIKMTVLAAATLPVTICFTADADDIYNHYVGSDVLAVPCGSQERLQLWPGLRAADEFNLKGTGWSESCADVVLSSAGWVAVTAGQNNMVKLQPWTPEARGCHVRIPPALPRAVAVKGQRMFRSPAYGLFNDRIKLMRKT